MLVVLKSDATPAQTEAVCAEIRAMGFAPHSMPGAGRTAIGITGNKGPVNALPLEALPGVERCIPVTQAYKLVLREMKPEGTVIDLKGTKVGGGATFTVIAGPCSVESVRQMDEVARFVKDQGIRVLRGGAFKPRTSPYSFQGLEQEGLKILNEIGAKHGLATITEVMDTSTVDDVAGAADILQIGARNMQNFSLLKRVGKASKPVFLKRGMSATLEELLLAAEYVLHGGNHQVMLCERGVRTFADHTRNTLDLSIVPSVQRLSHLPIFVDPSHAIGRRYFIEPMAKAALACGADGLMVEVTPDPDHALSDGAQTLDFKGFEKLMQALRHLAGALGRKLN
ncbi:MAG: 3-deoxy-7-phosphoheptulonate synthase [Planctomycetota bacterium]|nr:3-deoxy-7-phosphoheptulonate synthase [Planctomycetota bacterium]